MLDTNMLPYAPRIDAPPFGCDSAMASQLMGEQLEHIAERLDREIHILHSEPLKSRFGNTDTVHPSCLMIETDMNAVVVSARRILGAHGLRTAGLCVFTEDGVGKGSLVWVNMPRNGITNDFELGILEATLAHELWHSVGLRHCKDGKCLMSPDLSGEALYELVQVPYDNFCHDHQLAVRSIARDRGYFARPHPVEEYLD